ncbi:TonB-dependent receptor [Pontitalea aquivivens]|uniref:TonB-dependent receptor n=1 Tax=Pontitalea aquivivens TaxID=3388663 RepID=UPI003970F1B2
MSMKMIASLRQPGLHGAGLPARNSLALATVAVMGTAAPVGAQTVAPDVITLPTLEVETTAPEQPVVVRRPRVAAQAPAPAASPAPVPVAQTAPGPVAGTGGLSPYADPNAGYRAVTSGNSLLGQPLSQTARTVNAITAEVLADKNATSVRELARTTPGLTLGTGEGGNAFGDVLYIRGFKATNDVYIDGVRDAGAALRETFNTEQVEITKGPSGSIGGRGTTGGAVNVVTKKPQADDFVQTETTLGLNALARQTVDWNKVWNDRFRTRIGVMAQTAEVAGRDGIEDDRRGLSLAAEYDASDRLKLTLDAYHLEMSGTPDWGIPWINGGPATETIGLDRDTTYTVEGRDFQDGFQDIATLGLRYDISPDVALTNRTRIGRTGIDYVVSVPSGATLVGDDWILSNLSAKSTRQINRTLSNTTELSFGLDTGAVRHSLIAGLGLSREKVTQWGYAGAVSEDFGGVSGSSCSNLVTVVNPDTAVCWPVGSTLTLSGPPRVTEVDTVSVYLTDTMALSDRLDLNLGLRVDDYDIMRTGGAGEGAYRYARQDTLFSWNAGLTYRLNDQGMAYLAYATSANPMGQELDAGGGAYSGLDEPGQLLDPEKNRAIELGTKWDLGHLGLTAAAFQTTKSNARETLGRGASAVTSATGKYRVRGIELGIAGKVTDRLSLYGGATWMDSKVLASAVADDIGKELANTAHKQFNLLAQYRLTDAWTIGGQATWNGGQNLGTMAANGNTLPAYWRLDAMAEYDLGDDRVLSMRVDNLLDETYYDTAYRSGSPFVYVAPGRTASVTLSMKF